MHVPRLIACSASLATLLTVTPGETAELILLQRNIAPDVSGTTFLMLDRNRILLVRVRKEEGLEHQIEIGLAAEPTITIKLRCIDPAVTRQVLDALRTGGPPVLDVTARCEF